MTEAILTFAVAGLAMFILQERTHSNQYAAATFIFFFAYALWVGDRFEGTPEYFVWSIVSTPVFILLILQMNTFTTLGLLLCLTEFALLLIDIVLYITYTVAIWPLYTLALGIKPIVTTLQLASLLVKDGRAINIYDELASWRSICVDLAKSFRNHPSFVVCTQTLYNGQNQEPAVIR